MLKALWNDGLKSIVFAFVAFALSFVATYFTAQLLYLITKNALVSVISSIPVFTIGCFITVYGYYYYSNQPEIDSDGCRRVKVRERAYNINEFDLGRKLGRAGIEMIGFTGSTNIGCTVLVKIKAKQNYRLVEKQVKQIIRENGRLT